MSNLDKLLNGLKSVKEELKELNLENQSNDLTWFIEQVDKIINILETNKSISSLFLLLVQLLNKLKGQNN